MTLVAAAGGGSVWGIGGGRGGGRLGGSSGREERGGGETSGSRLMAPATATAGNVHPHASTAMAACIQQSHSLQLKATVALELEFYLYDFVVYYINICFFSENYGHLSQLLLR